MTRCDWLVAVKVRITIESQDEGASKTVDAVASIVRKILPGDVTGEDGAINHRTIYLDVEEAVALDTFTTPTLISPEAGRLKP